jgi:hypothetical protein
VATHAIKVEEDAAVEQSFGIGIVYPVGKTIFPVIKRFPPFPAGGHYFAGKSSLLFHQQTKLTKEFSLVEPVVEIAITSMQLHSAASHYIEMMHLVTIVKDGCSGPKIGYFQAAGDVLQGLLGKHFKRGVFAEKILGFFSALSSGKGFTRCNRLCYFVANGIREM